YADLYSKLTTGGGGFYSYTALRDTVIKLFEESDFDARTVNVGDKIVLIQPDNSRVITTYTGTPFTSQGKVWDFGGASFTITEDFLDQDGPYKHIHIDGLDNDFDGLI